MKNTKFFAKLIAVIMVVAMLATCLFACKKDDKKPDKKPVDNDVEEEVVDTVTPLVQSIINSVAKGDMKDLKVSGDLDLALTNGNNKSNYSISLKLDLNLYQGDNTANNTAGEVEIKDGDGAVLFGLYYYDNDENYNIDQGSAAFSSGKLYMQYKNGTSQEKLAITVPQVNATMKALDAKVDFSNVKLDQIDISGISDIFATIASITEPDPADETKFTINLTTVLTNFAGALEGIDLNGPDYPLGIALKGSDLATILPNIKIVVDYDINEDETFGGLDLAISLSDKDIIINKANAANDPILVVGMNGAVEVNPKLTFTVGADPVFSYAPLYDTVGAYKDMSLINAEVSLKLKVDKDIALKVMDAKEGSGGLKINLAADTYTVTLKVDADPTVVLGKLFSYEAATKYDANEIYFRKVNDKLYVRAEGVTEANVKDFYVRKANLGFGNLGAILDTIGSILECVNSLELSIVGEKADNIPLKLFAGRDTEAKGALKLTIANLGIVTDVNGNALLSGEMSNLSISALITAVTPVIVNLVKADEAADTTIFKTIAGYLTNAYIGLFSDKAESLASKWKHPGAHAEIAIDNIPFSGYTEFKGDYNAKYDYFKMATAEKYNEFSGNSFEAGKSYYTHDAVYSKVDTTIYTKPEDGTTYYTYDSATKDYVEATAISAWATGVEYFTKDMVYNPATTKEDGKTYYEYVPAKYEKVSVTKDTFESVKAATLDKKLYVGGSDVNAANPYGIGLNAKLDITSANGIVIDATVTGMDFIGLAPELTVKISGASASMFKYVVPTWADLNK